MRSIRFIAIAPGILAALVLATFAIPIPVWRTGELPVPPLPVVEGGPAADMPERIWIDTDAACGQGRTTDPDDCFALVLLAHRPGIEIAGISTVHGNAALDVTDRTTRQLMEVLQRTGANVPPVYRGSAEPAEPAGAHGPVPPAPAHQALREALEASPLTLLALGPLTNVAAALQSHPDLRVNVARLVAVMGRRPGHLFHPTEGAGGGVLFGHGPVFRDFNFVKDPDAAEAVMAMRLPISLVPYEAAREFTFRGEVLRRMERRGGVAAWTAERAGAWLGFWQQRIGRDGFYPFDLVAAAYVLRPDLVNCAPATGWVGRDDRLWPWITGPALLVGPVGSAPPTGDASSLVYCTGVDRQLGLWIMKALGLSISLSAIRPVSSTV